MDGGERPERVTWRNEAGSETRNITHVFLMTGALPNTRWLEGCVALDEKSALCEPAPTCALKTCCRCIVTWRARPMCWSPTCPEFRGR
jgi:hypothetical protein